MNDLHTMSLRQLMAEALFRLREALDRLGEIEDPSKTDLALLHWLEDAEDAITDWQERKGYL